MLDTFEKDVLYNFALSYVLTKKGTLMSYEEHHQKMQNHLSKLQNLLDSYKMKSCRFRHPIANVVGVVDYYLETLD
jgi:hypothetical protein